MPARCLVPTRALRPALLPPPSSLRGNHHHNHHCRPRAPAAAPAAPRRSFFTNPEPQTLTASARLPHHHAALYECIADIDAYSRFLPYCTESRVTRWSDQAYPGPTPPHSPSSPASDNPNNRDPPQKQQQQQQQEQKEGEPRHWPIQADLTAGWGGIQQTYSSRVLCLPARGVVEALSGDAAVSDIPASQLAAYGLRGDQPPSSSPSSSSSEPAVFKSLVTTWTVRPASAPPNGVRQGSQRGQVQHQHQHWSDVRLDIRFQFASPLYAALSSAVADKLAPVMMDAFIKRAEDILAASQR